MDMMDILFAQQTGGGGGGGSTFSVVQIPNRNVSIFSVSVTESNISIQGGSINDSE